MMRTMALMDHIYAASGSLIPEAGNWLPALDQAVPICSRGG